MRNSFSRVLLTGVLVTGFVGSAVYASENNDEKKETKRQYYQVLIESKNIVRSGKIKVEVVKEKVHSAEVEVNLIVQSQLLDQESLGEYREKMFQYLKFLHNKGYKKTSAVITLNSPLKLNNFEEFVKDKNIEVERFYIRTIDKNGNLGTISGIPSENDLVPEDKTKEFLNGAEVVGVYSIEGNILTDETAFNQLSKDNNVFLADISKKVIEEEVLNSIDFKKLKDKNEKIHIDVNIPNFYWFIEKNE
ncbi:hypothetical protein CS060_11400 [Anoxybacillus flavithermus]|uniref:Uncharacterized protein n=1 Tax=Anoxybacillus flavithermus TaxID=33934 RepID=A0A2G5RN12_9BACL|nr:hypothetical protein [Anoxybacillus flavithermus]PIC04127.1 hypothetical protein CS060_11400 [Anoxybacillus flavithermus]